MILHHEVVDPFPTVLKDCSIVGGLTALHTLKINIIKAEESQYGGPQVLFNEMYVKNAYLVNYSSNLKKQLKKLF